MGLVLLLVVLAVVVGGVGLLLEGLMWLFIIGLVLLAVALLSGVRARTRKA